MIRSILESVFYNNSRGVEIRNKYSKICLGKKDISWIKNSYQDNEICVFEGFFFSI